MIVVDANLIVHFCTETPTSALADAVWRKDPAWAAPLLWRSELRNVLATLVRARALGFEQARASMLAAERVLATREYTVVSHEVLRAAADSGCSAYDCEYVVLARALDVPLVTADRKIVKAFPGLAVSPDRFTSPVR